ncbi:MAG: hypothetical protein NTW49_08765 [Bacteroidia bacterium]|nr:hypothetical protein [Bacteroidia bacterium]
MKIRYFLPMIFLLLVISTIVSTRLYFKKEKEIARLENSLKVSRTSVTYYQTKNKLLAAKADAMELKYHEVSVLFPEVKKEIENLKVSPRLVNHYSETVVHQDKEIVSTLRDSIIKDTVKVKVFNYQDKFYSVKGIAINDTQKVTIHSTDSLIQLVYRGDRYHKWLWIFSRRKLQQVITSKNPNSKIVYCRDIEIIN